jgi:hypothetical protein
MATRLGIYNAALVEHLGERRLSSLTEDREPRRVLDEIWNNGFVDYILNKGFWKCALRTVRLDYDPDVTMEFGYTKAFAKPDDFIRTAMVSQDERFSSPYLDYSDESGYWYCDLEQLYVQYVSNSVDYGADISLWPPALEEYAATELALAANKRLTQGRANEDSLKKDAKDALLEARSVDAMASPTKFLPQGGWATARRSTRSRTGHNTNGTLVT